MNIKPSCLCIASYGNCLHHQQHIITFTVLYIIINIPGLYTLVLLLLDYTHTTHRGILFNWSRRLFLPVDTCISAVTQRLEKVTKWYRHSLSCIISKIHSSSSRKYNMQANLVIMEIVRQYIVSYTEHRLLYIRWLMSPLGLSLNQYFL